MIEIIFRLKSNTAADGQSQHNGSGWQRCQRSAEQAVAPQRASSALLAATLARLPTPGLLVLTASWKRELRDIAGDWSAFLPGNAHTRLMRVHDEMLAALAGRLVAIVPHIWRTPAKDTEEVA